jgi:hypothetical protein
MPGKFSNAFGAPNARAFDAPQAQPTQPNQGPPAQAGPAPGPPPGVAPGGPAAGPGGGTEAEAALANSLTQAADAMSAAGPTENVRSILQEFFMLVAGHIDPQAGRDVIAQAQGQAPGGPPAGPPGLPPV